MSPSVFLANMVISEMSVDLGRGNTRVSEQLLHVSQACAASQQVRCETVPQRVWRQLRRNSRSAGVGPKPEPEALSGDAPASRVQE